MQEAELVLNVIRNRGERGLPMENLFRQLFNPDLYLRAYGRIYRNEGATTRGTTNETVDRMSLEKLITLIEAVRYERHRWTPVRRIYIPKKNGKERPLGIPTWKDKLLQEVMRSLLDAYYEPQFSQHSHGFRPERGCHTALMAIAHNWKGTKWFIEGDIRGCFDNIDHAVLLSILQEKIHDNRFLRLVENLLKAGYMEDWQYRPTYSGTPQGGIISPILANIYLDRLDQFVEQRLLPAHNREERRSPNPVYATLQSQRQQQGRKGDHEAAKETLKQMRELPSGDPNDPHFRRLRYVRYADDFLLGFAGPKAEAEEIKAQIGEFLREPLKLELSPEKTLITQAADQAARFLGYEITGQQANDKIDRNNRRSVNRAIALRVPKAVLDECCSRYEKNGKPIHRPELVNDEDYTIISRYQSEYRGYVQYYALAQNLAWFGRIKWTMETSLLKTLASKHKTTVLKEAHRLRTTVQTDHGPIRCLEVHVQRQDKDPLIARFGGIPLRRKKQAILTDATTNRIKPERNELVKRLLAEECEICGNTENVEVHHIRKLADLKVKGRKEKPLHQQMMAARKRKTLVVCRECHRKIHTGTI